jgi:hypothetical protein
MPTISFSDRTVPPAVTVAQMPLNQRYRSAFVLVSAAALLVATIGFTLHTPEDAVAAARPAPNAVVAAPLAAAPVAPPVVAELPSSAVVPATELAAAPPAPPEAPAVPAAPALVKTAPPTVASPLAAPVRPSDPAARALMPRTLVAALGPAPGEARHPFAGEVRHPFASSSSSSSRTVRTVGDRPSTQATASRTVHGGLSSPGF